MKFHAAMEGILTMTSAILNLRGSDEAPVVKQRNSTELAIEAKIQQLQAKSQELRKAEINRLTRMYLHDELHGKPKKYDVAYVLKALLGMRTVIRRQERNRRERRC